MIYETRCQRSRLSTTGHRVAWCFLSLLLILSSGGCATKRAGSMEPLFYPSLPNEPRLQYLVSYGRPEDIEQPPSPLMTFLVGLPPPRSPILKPYGVAIHDGTIYVCDTVASKVHRIDLIDREWDYLAPQGPGFLRKAINIEVDTDGTCYVADTILGKVMVYSSQGQFIGSLGEGDKAKPVDVEVRGDRIYVAEMLSQSVQVYDKKDRTLVQTIPTDPQNDEERLFGPTNLDLDDEGRLYVSDSGAYRIQMYDAEGGYIRSFGRQGDLPGEFVRNKGVAVDRAGRLYAVDAGFQNIQIFNPEGQLLLFFASPGSGIGELSLPAAIAIDYDHNELFEEYVAPGFDLEYVVLVTSQYGPRKVSVYGFVHRKESTAEDVSP